MRIGILCDGASLSQWQRRAIDEIASGNELYLLITESRRPEARKLKWAAYYLLNLLAIRNRLTRPVAFPDGKVAIAGQLRFECAYDGNWALLPDAALEWIGAHKLDAIVKFGLNLLRIPEPDRLAAPILSYHHGDPRRFRGRPAGFYELLGGEPFMGQIVQVLSNRLDAGAVLAFAETRVIRHSYRRTLLEAYALSPYLLPRALAAVARGETLPIEPAGRNYRLPNNRTVARLTLRTGGHLIRRLAYGAFIEKQWRVARLAGCDGLDPAAAVRAAGQAPERWSVPPMLPGYTFYADGLFHSGPDDLLVEAMNGKTGRGELVRVRGDRQDRVTGFAGHLSFPALAAEDGRRFLLPEIVDWSRPALFELDGVSARKVADLNIDAAGLIDPMLLHHEGRHYLFGNDVVDGPSVLHLWSAPSLFARFERHLASPIRVSARGSRMAGPVLRTAAGLFRPGQDFRSGYGDGILSFRIETLTPDAYRESEAGEAAFTHVRGPHTIDVRDGVAAFDFYTERRSALAGVRRLRNRLAREPLAGRAVETG